MHNNIPDGYAQFWNCCKSQKGYSGTAIFSKVKPINQTNDFPNHDQEGRSITLEFEDFFIVAVYVPNAGEGLKRLDYRINKWDKDFQNYLLSLSKPVILTGDLNVAHNEIDVYDPKGKDKVPGYTPEERSSFGQFLARSTWIDTYRFFYPHRIQYSFWSARQKLRESNRGWRLDYFVVEGRLMDGKSVHRVADSFIHDNVLGSDHCPISIHMTKSGEAEL